MPTGNSDLRDVSRNFSNFREVHAQPEKSHKRFSRSPIGQRRLPGAQEVVMMMMYVGDQLRHNN